MKHISPIKFLTAVGFLIVSMNLQNLNAEEPKKTEPAKAVEKKEESKKTDAPDSTYAANTADVQNKWCDDPAHQNDRDGQRRNNCHPDSSSCKDDLKEYDKSLADYNDACSSIKSTGASCEEKMKACQKNLTSYFEPAEKEESKEDSSDIIKSFASMLMPSGGATSPTGETVKPPYDSCIEFDNDKTITAQDKLDSKLEKLESKKDSYDDKIRDIEEKISKYKEDENKAIEESKADTEKIDEEKNKFQKETAEAIAKLDKQKSEKYRAQATALAESAVKIRNIQSAMIKKQEEAEAKKFEHLQNMKQFAEDKISTQCKTAVDTAKACYVKSAKGILDPKDTTCSGMGAFTGKGAKGTAELKSKVAKMRDACFEQANMAVNKANFQQSQTLRSIESDIKEKASQITDLNDANARNAENQKAIDAEFDKDKSTEEQSLDKKMSEFATKIQNITAKVEAKKQKIATDYQRLNLNISEFNKKKMQIDKDILDAKNNKKNFTLPITQASNILTKHSGNRQAAYASCCPEQADGTKNKGARCSELAPPRGSSSKTSNLGNKK